MIGEPQWAEQAMSLVSLRKVSFTWSGPPLLDEVDLEIGRGERIGLLGRNGAGKSTLLKILNDEIEPDNGEVKCADGLRIGRLVQEVPAGEQQSVAQVVRAGIGEGPDRPPHWEIDQAVQRVLSRMSLEGDVEFANLSSGMKRRTLLAQALVREPDLLLLDEPTNHLDIESITWLEGFLGRYAGSLLFITHDRVFLQALATRILEVDRGHLFDWTCDYQTFLKRKEAALHAEEQQNALFDRKLAEEEVWIRQGIKARRTRNEGRVRALKNMREERHQRRERIGSVSMQARDAERSGRLVIEAKNVSFSYDGRPIAKDFSTLISRGDKVGIIGPNGAGKSTLLKLMLGDLKPQSGTIRHGTKLQVIYFDQLREQIDEEKTVVENVGEGQEILDLGGKKQHIYGYLQDFLFTPERARRPARSLSGGERNRLLLARIFKRPSNVMVLDEPTNDLDAETLELLEELVAGYSGTVLLVSHDRAFLNNVVTSTLVFEDGRVKEYDGGYDDYLRQRDAGAASIPQQEQSDTLKPQQTAKPSANKPRKLSYKERQELDSLPQQIEGLEAEQARLHSAMTAADYFRQDPATLAADAARLDHISTELAAKYERWETLAEFE
jgi:ABC transport system ATP-binding/permease protein